MNLSAGMCGHFLWLRCLVLWLSFSSGVLHGQIEGAELQRASTSDLTFLQNQWKLLHVPASEILKAVRETGKFPKELDAATLTQAFSPEAPFPALADKYLNCAIPCPEAVKYMTHEERNLCALLALAKYCKTGDFDVIDNALSCNEDMMLFLLHRALSGYPHRHERYVRFLVRRVYWSAYENQAERFFLRKGALPSLAGNENSPLNTFDMSFALIRLSYHVRKYDWMKLENDKDIAALIVNAPFMSLAGRTDMSFSARGYYEACIRGAGLERAFFEAVKKHINDEGQIQDLREGLTEAEIKEFQDVL